MKISFLAALLSGAAVSLSTGQELLWSDNFDADDTANFDGAPIAGRLSGLLGEDVVLRSHGAQQSINTGQLLIPGGGGVRFENNDGTFGADNRYNWAGGSTGGPILGASGFVVRFDWYPPGNGSQDWISFEVGTVNADSGNLVDDDYGILFRQNGNTERFDNSVNLGAGGTFTASAPGVVREVEIRYSFDSFADGTMVNAISLVDGVEVANDNFTWDNNLGEMRMELGNNDPGNRVDNLSVSTIAEPVFSVRIDEEVFPSGNSMGDLVGNLSAGVGLASEPATFVLIAGEGDTDNDKFQIVGSELQLGSYDFTGAGSTDGQEFMVRVQGTDDATGLQMAEAALVLTVLKEDDLDGLPDTWELAYAVDLTVLDGDGFSDADSDGLTDLDEYQISVGTSLVYPGITLPDLNPTLADTDGDTLPDADELDGTAGLRPATNPTLADTDGDGLDDGPETNTGIFVDAADAGTDPTDPDWDFDGLLDGFEADNAPPYDPTVDNSFDDFDGDGLPVIDEIFYGSSVLLADTDGDGLSDSEETINLVGLRPATNPALADTDSDGLTDLEETNTGIYDSPSDTGTDPTLSDTDGDGARDGFELDEGSDPFDQGSVPALPTGFALMPVTDDASTGISTAKTYTHAVSGGGVATVNGVDFEALTAALTPANLVWTTGTFSKDAIAPINNGAWVPIDGGVVDPGLQSLLGGFSYSGTGAQADSSQTFTLSGLTPGQDYELRLYIRVWDKGTSGRPIDLVFTNGAQVETPFQALLQDRPGIVLDNGIADSAYAIVFSYTAQGSEFTVSATVPMGAVLNSGSFHMYALTNEVVGGGGGGGELTILDVSRNGAGEIVIDFEGEADTFYDVTKSPDLQSGFGPLDIPLSVLTNGAGLGQAVVPTSEASEAEEYYRLEGAPAK